MSCGLIFQTQNDIFIAADTAASINFNETIYRKDENAKKLFVFDKMVVFCTGHLDFSYSLMDEFSKSDMKIDTLQKIAKDNFLKTYGNDFTLGKLDILAGTFLDDGKSVVYQISPYAQFEIIEHRIPSPTQFGFWSGGIMVDEALEIAWSEFSRTMKVIPTFQKTYDDISFEGVGGELIIYNINPVGIRKLYQSPIKEKDIKRFDYSKVIEQFFNKLPVQMINAACVRGLLGEFAKLRAGQIILNDDGTGLDDVYIKVSHTDGAYTEMNADGFLRYVPYPVYTTSSGGIPNNENFTINNTIPLLKNNGWEFGGKNNVVSNELLIGSTSSSDNLYDSCGRVWKYVSKSDTTFNFTYRTYANSNAGYYLMIDNTIYTLTQSATNTTFQATHGTVTLDEGWHMFEWRSIATGSIYSPPTYLYMYIDNIVFESSPLKKTQTGTDTKGTTYNYMFTTDTSSTISNIGRALTKESIPSALIQLPDTFKGKDFKIAVFLQDTGEVSTDYSLGKIQINVIEDSIDYDNATFRVQATVCLIGGTLLYYQGLDFVYIVTC